MNGSFSITNNKLLNFKNDNRQLASYNLNGICAKAVDIIIL